MGVANGPAEEICLPVSQSVCLSKILADKLLGRGCDDALDSPESPSQHLSLSSPTFQSFRHALKPSEGKSHNLKNKNFHLNMNTSGLRLCVRVCVQPVYFGVLGDFFLLEFCFCVSRTSLAYEDEQLGCCWQVKCFFWHHACNLCLPGCQE